jgi:tetratricopeptide (TPR) repeat protein
MKSGPLFSLLLTGLVAAACSPAASRPAVAPTQQLPATVVAAPVSNEAFGRAVHAVVYSTETSAKRLSLVAGVVQRQLNRAARRFDAGFRGDALTSVRGAILLVRAGEARDSMWQNAGRALEAAANEVARGGNQGQAAALYTLLLKAQPKPEAQRAARLHLEAMRSFDSHVRRHGPVETAGSLQRVAAHRALLDPSAETLQSASVATLDWIRTAMHSDVTERFAEANFDREEAVEAFRAIRSGAATIAALHLRHGDPQGALEFLEQNDLGRVVPTPLRTRLERAASGGDVQAFADLFRLFQSATEAEEPETAIDPDIAAGAAFGIAVELYRRAPENMSASGTLAALMIEYGMAEAVPHLIIPAVGSNPGAEALDYAVELVEQGLSALGRVSEVEGARKLLSDSAPLITVAEQPRMRARFAPKVARLRFLLGVIETRQGNLQQASVLLKEAARGQPQLETWSLLSQVERQLGDLTAALGALARQVEVCREKVIPASESEALAQTYEVESQLGHAPAAGAALQQALRRALDARQTARSGAEQARAERSLARVLELFGDHKSAGRALGRAIDAARADAGQYTASVLEASRMALTHSDLPAARVAVRDAKQGGLMPEDEVYVGTWLRILERIKHEPSDGTVEEALGNLDDISQWPTKLRAWTLGQIDAVALAQFATTPSQRTEALFYQAMQARIDGNMADSTRLLEQVTKSPTVELVELTVARDLLRAASDQAPPKLPTDVKVP